MQLRKFMGQGQKTATAFSLAPQASRLQASEKLYGSSHGMRNVYDFLYGLPSS